MALSTQNTMPGLQKAEKIAAVASEAKAEQITILDLRDLSNITDYFVVFTGTSAIHLRSVGDKIEEALRKEGIKPGQVDGQRGAGWVVFDYGSVIVHAMLKESRELFDLERLWGDAPRIDWE